MAAPSSVCRYFSGGNCQFGARCTYSHDRSARPSLICRYYERGNCVYGTACRFDHIRPRGNNNEAAASRDSKSSTKNAAPLRAPPPPPRALITSAFSPDAPEFVPTLLKQKPTNYAEAAGGSKQLGVWEDEAGSFSSSPMQLCPYFEMGSCTRPDCLLPHGEICDICQCAVLHPTDQEQRNGHLAECQASFEQDLQLAFIEQKSRAKTCGICMENIYDKKMRFGILENCKHCFCLDCIREWRKKTETFEAETVRSCPECRVHSDFVVPSVIWLEEPEEKAVLLDMFKSNTKEKACKYYKPYRTGDCPFGNKCFYKHINPDGSAPSDEAPGRRQNRSRILLSDFVFASSDPDDSDDFDTESLVTLLRALYS